MVKLPFSGARSPEPAPSPSASPSNLSRDRRHLSSTRRLLGCLFRRLVPQLSSSSRSTSDAIPEGTSATTASDTLKAESDTNRNNMAPPGVHAAAVPSLARIVGKEKQAPPISDINESLARLALSPGDAVSPSPPKPAVVTLPPLAPRDYNSSAEKPKHLEFMEQALDMVCIIRSFHAFFVSSF